MANNRPRRNYAKGQREAFVRYNDRIRVQEVRLIGANGEMIGVVPIEEARMEARRAGLDLIEISPNATPPVCRILDFGKYQYETTKKQKTSKIAATKIKEVKFRFCTEAHDYATKLRHITEFLNDGNKVKISVFFKGRELDQTQLGFELVRKMTIDLASYATLEMEAKLVGRNIVAIYSPVKNLKQKQNPKAPGVEESIRNTIL
ncbi:MAG: translation initiation factor IF-3 [Puniceicoccales bacterium]|jgi:translation initiation factor IF-3|nr:translation initiation factor IF-3 [Puniceicoccales bacterium]